MEFTHHIDDAVMPNITAEREEFNAKQPADPAAAPGADSGLQFTTNETFLAYHVDGLVRGWISKHARLPAPPPPPDPNALPAFVSKKQGLKALARADLPEIGRAAPIYEADIVARIEALPEATAAERLRKNDMRIEFRDASTWRPGNAFFETMVAALGVTPEQRDNLLRLAITFQD